MTHGGMKSRWKEQSDAEPARNRPEEYLSPDRSNLSATRISQVRVVCGRPRRQPSLPSAGKVLSSQAPTEVKVPVRKAMPVITSMTPIAFSTLPICER